MTTGHTTIHVGNCLDVLKTLPAESVQCVVTSPPYYGLRDYGTAAWEGGDAGCDHLGPPKSRGNSTLKNDGRPQDKVGQNNYERKAATPYRATCARCGARRIDNQLGLEPTPAAYVAALVDVFREVRRVLRDDGTCWVNLGDSYNAGRDGGHPGGKNQWKENELKYVGRSGANVDGLKPKDLIGIPWKVAFALQDDGWWLRSDVIWHKPNPMPESVTDRPTKSHEYVFLLSKSASYFYDAEAVREEIKPTSGVNIRARARTANGALGGENQHNMEARAYDEIKGANRRTVWTIATQPYSGAHFATMPPALVEPCIKAGTSERGCCPECGAPWERVVERTAMEVRPGPSREARSQDGQLRTQVNGTMTKAPTSTTTGWQPTCDHDAEPVNCTVLDMFGGACTTALVANRLGRDAIIIELSPDYAEMGRLRLIDDAPMFAAVEVAA